VNEGRISISRTDGGIPFVMESIPSSDSVAMAALVRAGSRNEPRERAGMAHLLEHMVFRGTRNLDSRRISEIIEDAGGELNGFTSKEFTCYYSSILREMSSTAGEVLKELVCCPTLGEESFGLERQIVTQEVNMLLNEPDSYIQYLFNTALWEGHPMSVPEAGDFETIDAISLSDLREFYSSNYARENIILVASGGADRDELMEWASTFDDLPTGRERTPQTPPTPRAEFRLFEREGDQAYVGLGFPGVPASDPDRQAQRLLSAVLGAGMSSRLFQSVRERLGLVYSIFTTSKHYTDCGSMSTYFSCSAENLPLVLEQISREFSLLKDQGLERGELDRSKRLIKGATVRRLESTESRMFRIGDAYAMTGEVKPARKTLEEMDAVTDEDVMAISETILRPENLCLALHGPESAGREDPRQLDF
jgi:predicted Zn-dependent peptidase